MELDLQKDLCGLLCMVRLIAPCLGRGLLRVKWSVGEGLCLLDLLRLLIRIQIEIWKGQKQVQDPLQQEVILAEGIKERQIKLACQST